MLYVLNAPETELGGSDDLPKVTQGTDGRFRGMHPCLPSPVQGCLPPFNAVPLLLICPRLTRGERH